MQQITLSFTVESKFWFSFSDIRILSFAFSSKLLIFLSVVNFSSYQRCGACSNWDDLSLQWTTRTYLASEGQKW